MIYEKDSSDAHKCSVCDQFVRAVCGSYSEDSEGFRQIVTYNICVRKNQIYIDRGAAKSGQEQQAQKMVSLSNSRLPAVNTGTNVVIRVPDIYRGHLAPRNVLAVIVDVISSGLHLLDIKKGLLKRLYACNEFATADSNFIDAHDMPSTSLSLWSASVTTPGSKQGFLSFDCKMYCINKKCNSRWKNTKCNSKCHSNSSCKNK